MTTITKEWLKQTIAEFENNRDDIPFGLDDDDAKILKVLKQALASLDENIQLQREKDAIEAVALALRDDMRQAREQLEEAEKQIVELSRAASVNSQWKPDVCPVTGRKFFMWIEHETLGYVPTYGGPLDSYTIPTRDSSGEFSCERYDHDIGGWVDGEFIGLYLIDDDEQCRVCGLEERIAELEARELTLPPRAPVAPGDLRRSFEAVARLNNEMYRWTSCMSYNGSYVGEPEGLLKRNIREIERILDRCKSDKGE